MRNSVQTLSVTRGTVTVTYTVDYGEHPPTVKFYVSTPEYTARREELMPRRFGTSIAWWMRERRGIVASGRAEWRADLTTPPLGVIDVCSDEGADLLVALTSARLAAAKRWRVVRRRMEQAGIDGAKMRAMIEDGR